MSKKNSNPPPPPGRFKPPPPISPPDRFIREQRPWDPLSPPPVTVEIEQQFADAEERIAVLDALAKKLRRRWEYMVLCPDSEAGYRVLLQEVGEEGWEAACSWADVSPTGRRTNHILFKRRAMP